MSVAPETEPLGRREKKKLETRRALKRSALKLALELGLENLTVEAITDEVGVSPRTFFNYFDCKEDALIGETSGAAEEIRTNLLARPSDEPILLAIHRAIVESELIASAHEQRETMLQRQRLIHEHPALVSRQFSEAVTLDHTLTQAIAERLDVEPETDLRPRLLAAMTSSVLRIALMKWTKEDGRLNNVIDECFETLADTISH